VLTAGVSTRMLRFFGIAFAITWIAQFGIVALSIEPGSPLGLALLLVAGFGPTIAAFACGRPSFGAPADLTLILIALALPSLINLIFGGHPGGGPEILAAVLPPLGEEPGWRGYAQERMVARFGRPLGFLLLGIIWSVWHLPTTFLYGGVLATFPLFLCRTTLASIWVSWIYERSGILGAIVAHAGLNLGLVAGSSQVLTFIAWAAIAFAILLARWPGKKSPDVA
jgi:membrane protease YdiL (CAAX protease family)